MFSAEIDKCFDLVEEAVGFLKGARERVWMVFQNLLFHGLRRTGYLKFLPPSAMSNEPVSCKVT